jgi:multiple sugar transport system substrate-binding protein
MNFGGQIFGLYDDGDTMINYYRRDLIEDPTNQTEFQAQYGRPLAAPTTYAEYDEVQAFFTEKMAPDLYGGASQRVVGGLYNWFLQEYRTKGGRFFDPESMDALVNGEAGLATLTRMIKSNETMPPDVEQYGFEQVLTDWMGGKLAMIGGTWPPIGRWSEAYGADTPQLSFVPASQVADKVGYSAMMDGRSACTGGFLLSVSAQSQNKEAAYLFAQWLNSPSISLQRCMLPYALRDPYRTSHFESAEYRALWTHAGEYLDTLKSAADGALLDIIMPGSFEYHDAVDQAVTGAMAGSDPQESLDTLASTWNEITDRLGRDKQKEAYAAYVALKGSYQE